MKIKSCKTENSNVDTIFNPISKRKFHFFPNFLNPQPVNWDRRPAFFPNFLIFYEIFFIKNKKKI